MERFNRARPVSHDAGTPMDETGEHGDHEHQGGRPAGRRLARHRQQRAQPARPGRRPRPASGCSTRSASSATSATTRPASCGPAAAAPSPSWCSTWPTRSSPTSSAAPSGGRARSAGAVVVVCNSGEDPGPGAPPPRPARGAAGPGRAHHPGRRRPRLPAGQLIARGIPVVLVDRGSGHHHRCSVAVDDVLGGRLAGAHLRRAAGTAGSPSSADRPRSAGRRPARRRSPLRSARAASCGVVETPSLTVAAGRRAAGEIADLPAAAAADRGVLRQRPARARRAAGDDPARACGSRATSRSSATTTSSSPPRPPCRCPRSASRASSSAAPRPSCCWRRPTIQGRHEHRHVVFQPELVVRESSSRQHRRRERSTPPA